MENMEVSHQGVDVKLAGVKRKAVTEELRDSKKQPTEVPQVDSGFGRLHMPGRFLKLREVLEICRNPENVLHSVPPGRKSNVFFIVDDSINSLKRERNEPPKYHDDCGEWRSKDFARNFYVQLTEGNITCMKTRDNLFYKDSHVRGGSFLAPLNPQPDPDTLIKVYRRIFLSGKARNSYKKRVTALSGNGMKSIAVIEYSCTNNAATFGHVHETDKKGVHGVEKSTNADVNSKHLLGTEKKGVHKAEKSLGIGLNSENVLGSKKKVVHNVVKRLRGRPPLKRVDSAIKRPRGRPPLNRVQNVVKRPRGRPPRNKIKYGGITAKHHMINRIQAKSKKCRHPTLEERETNGNLAFETHEKLLGHDDWVPRSIRQASHKPVHTTTGLQNNETSAVCDEDFVMVGMLEENPSVQEVINRKAKPPCVILYSEEQFSDMRRNLECESVLGVDCTHKFGDCYATMTVYQNSRALHKDTNEPILFLGPVYLHWDKEFLTYVSFFSHMMDKLEGIEPNIEVKLGNDVGQPLFKALKFSFPTSPYILDCHHLKKTVNRVLTIVSGKFESCSTILDQIFGKDGIINSSCLSAFENGVSDLVCHFDEFPDLKSYFDDLQLFLYPYVCEPHQRGISQKLWVNGNDEVLNNQFDTVLKCKQNKLSEIVEKICAISEMQMLELKDV